MFDVVVLPGKEQPTCSVLSSRCCNVAERIAVGCHHTGRLELPILHGILNYAQQIHAPCYLNSVCERLCQFSFRDILKFFIVAKYKHEEFLLPPARTKSNISHS
jgi:hypothetical protein